MSYIEEWKMTREGRIELRGARIFGDVRDTGYVLSYYKPDSPLGLGEKTEVLISSLPTLNHVVALLGIMSLETNELRGNE